MKLLPLVIFGASAMAAQSLAVVPAQALIDEPVVIGATGLAPHERATIRAELTDGGGQQWASHADFVADQQGAIEVSRQAPAAGSYKDVSPMGLIWSMMPVKKGVNSYLAQRDLRPQMVEFHLLRQGQEIANAHLEQRALADGVQHTPIHDQGLRGMFFVPGGTGPHPAVLVVGGSNGGLPVRAAAWVASHGFAALALAYFRYEDLPPQLESIPLEYFQKALQWMTDRPEIGNSKIAVIGTSRGGELALQLGSMFPRIGAVVAYVPSNVRVASCCRETGGPAWTWQGRALAYVMPRRSGPAERARAAIHVEDTHGPILMISGEADHLWNSWEMADEVVSRLRNHHFPYSFENLKYPHAGHLAGRQEFVPAWHGEIRNPTSGRENDLGGSAEGDAKSTEDSMPKVLDFLGRNLAGR